MRSADPMACVPGAKAHASDARQSSVPDVIMPAQFFDAIGRDTSTPEKRLMCAVLVDALIHLDRGGQAGVEARRWIEAGAGGTSAVTFAHACDVLGLHREYLVRGILAWAGDPSAQTEARRSPRRGERITPPRRIVAPRVPRPRRRNVRGIPVPSGPAVGCAGAADGRRRRRGCPLD